MIITHIQSEPVPVRAVEVLDSGYVVQFKLGADRVHVRGLHPLLNNNRDDWIDNDTRGPVHMSRRELGSLIDALVSMQDQLKKTES